MSTDLLIVFVRNPEIGKVKTRLANAIGKEAALEIYKELLAHTHKICSAMNCEKWVMYSEHIGVDDLWDEGFQKHLQSGTDLGAKMLNAFEKGFQTGFKKIVLIGSDLFDITVRHLNNAFEALDHDDYIVGPATDGGYYLIGMKRLNPVPFYNKSWGTPTVFQATLEDLGEENVFLLDPLNDIDTIDDLKDHPVYKQWRETYD